MPNPGSVSFGHLLVGTQAPDAVVFLTNQGNAPLSFTGATVSGTGFSIVSNGCGTSTLPAKSGCAIVLAFTPDTAGAKTGVLTIASNDPDHPQLLVNLTGMGDDTYAAPDISSLSQGTVQINNGSVKIQISGDNFYPASVVQLNGTPQATTFENNGLLQVTLAASSLTGIGELPVTVVNPAPGGGASAPSTITLYQTLPIGASFVVSVPATNLLYAAIPASSNTNPNTVISIDPTTGTLGTPIPVGNDPRFLAASDDGKYLYVALSGDHTIQRINLQTSAIERTFAYPPSPSNGITTPFSVADMHVVPGSPQQVVLAGEMVAAYNDSGLINAAPSSYPGLNVTGFTFTNDPATLYALPLDLRSKALEPFTLDSAGVHTTVPTGLAQGINGDGGFSIVSDGTLVYTSNGSEWDPVNQKLLGTLPLSIYNDASAPNAASLTADATLGRVFFIGEQAYGSNSSAVVLSAYDTKSLQLDGSLAFAQIQYPDVSDLCRWGANGFAFIAAGPGLTDQELYLTRSSMLTPASTNPTPALSSISPTSAIAGSGMFTLTINGTGFVSASTVSWSGTALQTGYVSSTQLTALVPAVDIAESGNVQITVTNPPPGGGVSPGIIFQTAAASPQVALSPSSLSFGNINQGSLSSTQTITLLNTGTAALSIAGIAPNGDFSQTNACGTSLAVNASCQIAIVFTPMAAGPRAGTLTINDNANGSPQVVTLTGNGVAPLTIGSGNGGSTTATVSSGQSATYALSLSGGPGFSGTVTLTCTGAPQNAACSIAPATEILSPGGSANFTVTVSTGAAKTAYLPQGQRPVMAALGFLSFLSLPVLLLLRKQLPTRTLMLSAATAFLLSGLTACGSNGGSQAGTSAATVPGTYTLTVTASTASAAVTQTLTLVVQ